jgi:hypothetical protein
MVWKTNPTSSSGGSEVAGGVRPVELEHALDLLILDQGLCQER